MVKQELTRWAENILERETADYLLPRYLKDRVFFRLDRLVAELPWPHEYGPVYERTRVVDGCGQGYTIFSRDSLEKPTEIGMKTPWGRAKLRIRPKHLINVGYACHACDAIIVGPPRFIVRENYSELPETENDRYLWDGLEYRCRFCDKVLLQRVVELYAPHKNKN